MPATVAEIKEQIHSLDDDFLDCRDLRHSWVRVGKPYRDGRFIKRRLQCSRCETFGIDVWTGAAKRIRRHYEYADGYIVKGGGVKPQYVRDEFLSRVDVYASEDDMMESMFNGSTNSKRRKRR